MSEYEPWQKVRCYRVTAWEAPREGVSKYGRQHNFGVVTTSAKEALTIISERHPECRIDAVNETCIVHYVSDLHRSPSAGDVDANKNG
jgi:hypothetical protein